MNEGDRNSSNDGGGRRSSDEAADGDEDNRARALRIFHEAMLQSAVDAGDPASAPPALIPPNDPNDPNDNPSPTNPAPPTLSPPQQQQPGSYSETTTSLAEQRKSSILHPSTAPRFVRRPRSMYDGGIYAESLYRHYANTANSSSADETANANTSSNDNNSNIVNEDTPIMAVTLDDLNNTTNTTTNNTNNTAVQEWQSSIRDLVDAAIREQVDSMPIVHEEEEQIEFVNDVIPIATNEEQEQAATNNTNNNTNTTTKKERISCWLLTIASCILIIIIIILTIMLANVAKNNRNNTNVNESSTIVNETTPSPFTTPTSSPTFQFPSVPEPSTPKPTTNPTSAPTADRSESMKLRKTVIDTLLPLIKSYNDDATVFEDNDNDNNTPNQVLNWMVHNDTFTTQRLTSSPNNGFNKIRLLERYIIVHIYFSTNGKKWKSQYNFLSIHSSVCSWHENNNDNNDNGIFCNYQGRVSAILLPNNNLRGTFPSELVFGSTFDALHDIWLHQNRFLQGHLSSATELEYQWQLRGLLLGETSFDGTIPTEIGKLRNLRGFSLRDTKISGTIPTEIGNCRSLTHFDLDNTLIGGTIPTEIGLLSNLRRLFAYQMKLKDATIPTEIGRCTSLELLALDDNLDLHGTIPTEIGFCTRLKYINLSSNRLSGTIPNTIKNLQQLEWFGAYDNELTGSIPSFKATSIQNIQLDTNQLNGTIPSKIATLTNLQSFDVSFNEELSGTIPIEFANLSLDWFSIGRTSITGNLDSIFCFDSSQTQVVSDCHHGDDGDMPPQTTCSCCTWCCSRGIKSCFEQPKQPASCNNECVACDYGLFATSCEQCPSTLVEIGNDENGIVTKEEMPICARSCAVNETSGACEDRVEFLDV